RPTEGEVVDGAGVALEESTESVGIAADGGSPQIPIPASHYFVHVRSRQSVPDRDRRLVAARPEDRVSDDAGGEQAEADATPVVRVRSAVADSALVPVAPVQSGDEQERQAGPGDQAEQDRAPTPSRQTHQQDGHHDRRDQEEDD